MKPHRILVALAGAGLVSLLGFTRSQAGADEQPPAFDPLFAGGASCTAGQGEPARDRCAGGDRAQHRLQALRRLERAGPGHRQDCALRATGRLADAQGDHPVALAAYREAVAVQDKLPYMEPP